MTVTRYRSVSNPVCPVVLSDRCNERKRKYENAVVGLHGVVPQIRRTLLASTCGREAMVTSIRIEFYHGSTARVASSKSNRPTDENLADIKSSLVSEILRELIVCSLKK